MQTVSKETPANEIVVEVDVEEKKAKRRRKPRENPKANGNGGKDYAEVDAEEHREKKGVRNYLSRATKRLSMQNIYLVMIDPET